MYQHSKISHAYPPLEWSVRKEVRHITNQASRKFYLNLFYKRTGLRRYLLTADALMPPEGGEGAFQSGFILRESACPYRRQSETDSRELSLNFKVKPY